MRKLLVLFAVLFTVILSLNYIIGMLQPHPGLVFLGSVHYPVDYFYYLSLFAQGQTRWITAIDLYTHDFTKPFLYGFTNVLAGRILSFAGISPIAAYQIMLTLYTLIFFLLVIGFLERYYPTQKSARIIAFILFFIANIFPGASSFYSNMTEPLVRFVRVPHKMLGLICIILPIILIQYIRDKKSLLSTKIAMYVLLGICAVIEANTNMVQWVFTGTVLFITLLWVHLAQYPMVFRGGRKNVADQLFTGPHSLFSSLIPAIIFCLAGIPMAINLLGLFKILPFSRPAAWEYNVPISMEPLGLLKSFGPVVILALLGLPIALKKQTLSRVFIISYFILSFLLFFSPVNTLLHVTRIRFISGITILGAGVLTTDFLTGFPVSDPKKRLIIAWCTAAAIGFILIPLFIAQYERSANLDLNNSYIYFSTQTYDAFMEAKNRMTASDVILVTWPYDVSFPALTGRRGFMGNPDQTINNDEKNHEAYLFFAALESDAAMHKFLIDNHITYVLEFTDVTTMIKPFLTASYRNPLLTLYKVAP